MTVKLKFNDGKSKPSPSYKEKSTFRLRGVATRCQDVKRATAGNRWHSWVGKIA